MKNQSTASRNRYPFDLQSVMRRLRMEHLGTIGSHPFHR